MVLKKLMDARLKLHGMGLEKTGENKFAGYKYFELGDFLVPAQKIFAELDLCGVVSFTADVATLTITDLEDSSFVQITSPMGSAALKGCHEVQNIGAVETYQRRYLWVAAFEIVEHDALDATTGNPKAKPEPKPKGTPKDGVWERFDSESQAWLLKVAAAVMQRAEDPEDALDYLESEQLDADEKTAVWTRLDSKTRTALKAAHNKKVSE